MKQTSQIKKRTKMLFQSIFVRFNPRILILLPSYDKRPARRHPLQEDPVFSGCF